MTNAEIQAYLDAENTPDKRINTTFGGRVLDVQGLKDTMTALQETEGLISPQDQELLDSKAEAFENETPAPEAPPL